MNESDAIYWIKLAVCVIFLTVLSTFLSRWLALKKLKNRGGNQKNIKMIFNGFIDKFLFFLNIVWKKNKVINNKLNLLLFL